MPLSTAVRFFVSRARSAVNCRSSASWGVGRLNAPHAQRMLAFRETAADGPTASGPTRRRRGGRSSVSTAPWAGSRRSPGSRTPSACPAARGSCRRLPGWRESRLPAAPSRQDRQRRHEPSPTAVLTCRWRITDPSSLRKFTVNCRLCWSIPRYNMLGSPGKKVRKLGLNTTPKRTFLGDPGSFMVSEFP